MFVSFERIIFLKRKFKSPLVLLHTIHSDYTQSVYELWFPDYREKTKPKAIRKGPSSKTEEISVSSSYPFYVLDYVCNLLLIFKDGVTCVSFFAS